MQNTGMRGHTLRVPRLAHLISVSFLVCPLRVHLVRTRNSVSCFNTRSWNCVSGIATRLGQNSGRGKRVFSPKRRDWSPT
jgi:hypothetical protein